jgi:hypothetical protein
MQPRMVYPRRNVSIATVMLDQGDSKGSGKGVVCSSDVWQDETHLRLVII